MQKLTLGPVAGVVARKLAEQRGITIEQLVTDLLNQEAALVLAFKDNPRPTDHFPKVQPQPDPARAVCHATD